MNFYIISDNSPQGPYSSEEIVTLFRNDKLTLATLVWHEGLSEWKPIRGVASILDQILPHLPLQNEANETAKPPLLTTNISQDSKGSEVPSSLIFRNVNALGAATLAFWLTFGLVGLMALLTSRNLLFALGVGLLCSLLAAAFFGIEDSGNSSTSPATDGDRKKNSLFTRMIGAMLIAFAFLCFSGVFFAYNHAAHVEDRINDNYFNAQIEQLMAKNNPNSSRPVSRPTERPFDWRFFCTGTLVSLALGMGALNIGIQALGKYR
jgi:hypothetical protein